jgi:hypothetical protein
LLEFVTSETAAANAQKYAFVQIEEKQEQIEEVDARF